MRHTLLTLAALSSPLTAATMPVYFGTQNRGGSQGLYRAEFDPATGALGNRTLALGLTNCHWLVRHPRLPILYAVSEGDKTSGRLNALRIQGDGTLLTLNQVPSQGRAPCYLAVNDSATALYVANYTSATVVAQALNPDGSLGHLLSTNRHDGSGPNLKRQKEAHAHSVRFDPSRRWVLAADLGTDTLMAYTAGADGALQPRPLPAWKAAPGDGPRHFDFSPDGKWLTVTHELSCFTSLLRWDGERGMAEETGRAFHLNAGEAVSNRTASEVRFHPTLPLLFAATREADILTTFRYDATGRITAIGRTPTGSTGPRGFNFSPDGRFILVANQQPGSVTVLRVNADFTLTNVGESFPLPGASCVLF